MASRIIKTMLHRLIFSIHIRHHLIIQNRHSNIHYRTRIDQIINQILVYKTRFHFFYWALYHHPIMNRILIIFFQAFSFVSKRVNCHSITKHLFKSFIYKHLANIATIQVYHFLFLRHLFQQFIFFSHRQILPINRCIYFFRHFIRYIIP